MRVSEASRDASFSGLYARETARDVLSRVPAGAESVRCLTAGQWGLIDWIDAWDERLTAAGETVTGLDVATWGMAGDVEVNIAHWLRRFDGRVRFVFDGFQLTRNRAKSGETSFRRVADLLGAERWRAAVTHWKGARLLGTDTVLVGTGNLGADRRVEAMLSDRDAEWYAAVGGWFDALFEHVAPAGLSGPDLMRPRMQAEGWNALELAAAARLPRAAGQPPAAQSASAPVAPAPVVEPLPITDLAGELRRRVQERLASPVLVPTAEVSELVRQLQALVDLENGVGKIDLKVAGRVCDRLEEVVTVRTVSGRRELAGRPL